jgi:flagellar protein FliO/FliZ
MLFLLVVPGMAFSQQASPDPKPPRGNTVSPAPTRAPVDEPYPGQGGTPAPSPAPGNNNQKLQEPVATVNTWDFINMILGLLVVVAIIYFIFFFLKKGMGRRIAENDLIKVLGSRILSGTKAIHVVEIGGAVYIIGSANDSVNLISEVDKKEALDAIKLAAAQVRETRTPRFVDVITQVFRPSVKKQLEINESIDFMKKQRSRLNKLK